MGKTNKSARNHPSSAASAALGAFLRAMRSRTKPESVGIPSVGQRRVPGLRREEVAQLPGIGVAWYRWLEQGHDVNGSSDVLDRLYGALALSGPRAMLMMNSRILEADRVLSPLVLFQCDWTQLDQDERLTEAAARLVDAVSLASTI
jgi:hypothetical protein